MKFRITLIIISIVFLIPFVMGDSFAEWEKFQIKNDKVSHIHPNMTFNFFYNTNVTDTEFYLSSNNEIFNFKFDEQINANIGLKIPKNYPLSDIFPNPIAILADQTEQDVGLFTSSNCFNEVTVITNDIQRMELIGVPSMSKSYDDYQSESVPRHCLSQTIVEYEEYLPLTPREQIKNGIIAENTICLNHLELIFKPNDSPVCIKPSTAEKLIERGWSKQSE